MTNEKKDCDFYFLTKPVLYEKPVMNMKKTVIITFQHTCDEYEIAVTNMKNLCFLLSNQTCVIWIAVMNMKKTGDFYLLTKPVLYEKLSLLPS